MESQESPRGIVNRLYDKLLNKALAEKPKHLPGDRRRQAADKILGPKPTRYEKAVKKILEENEVRTKAGNRMSGLEYLDRMAAVDGLRTRKDERREKVTHAG